LNVTLVTLVRIAEGLELQLRLSDPGEQQTSQCGDCPDAIHVEPAFPEMPHIVLM
jgi:hypothetical protein